MEVLTAMLLGLLQSAAYDYLKNSIKRTFDSNNPIFIAIECTVKKFSNIEDLNNTLEAWIKNPSTLKLIEKSKIEDVEIDSEAVDSFIDIGFSYDDQTNEVAKEILMTFINELNISFLNSTRGHEIQELRAIKRQNETVEIIKEQTTIVLNEIQKSYGRSYIDGSVDDLTDIDIKLKVYHARIDSTRDLIKQGKYIMAKTQLEGIRNDSQNIKNSEEIQFRISTNIGVCCLNIDEFEQACAEFDLALKLRPENIISLINGSQSALINKDNDKALKLILKAYEIDKNDEKVISEYLWVLHIKDDMTFMARLLDEISDIENKPSCLNILGLIYFERSNYIEAEKHLRNSIKLQKENPITLLFLGLTLVESLAFEFKDNPPFVWQIKDEMKTKLDEGIELLSSAIEIFKGYESPNRLCWAIYNKAKALAMIGNYDDALKNCQYSLDINNSYDPSLILAGEIYLQKGEYKEAIKNFSSLTHILIKKESIPKLGLALFKNKQFKEAKKTLENILDYSKYDDSQLEIFNVLLKVYEALNEPKSIEKVLNALRKHIRHNPLATLILAQYKINLNYNDEAFEILAKAYSVAEGQTKSVIAINMADILFGKGNYIEALQYYEQVADTTNDNEVTRNYLSCLYNAKKYKKALDIAQSLRNNKDPIPHISEIESLILQYYGNISEAIELELKLCITATNKFKHQIRLVFLYLRNVEQDKAKGILSEIDIKDIDNNAEALMQIAEIRSQLNLDNVLPLAYRARRIAFKIPEIHLAYITIILQRGDLDKDILNVDKIDNNTAFLVKKNGKEEIFFIVDDIPKEKNEFSIQDKFAIKFLDHKVGDLVELKKTPYEKITCEILDIQNKYVYAFNETINNFSTWFPDNPYFHKVAFTKDDKSLLFKSIDDRSEYIEYAYTFYKDKLLTVGALAKHFSFTPIEVWHGLIAQPNRKYHGFDGNIKRTINEIQLIANNKTVVLDTLALLTISILEIENYITDYFQEIFVAQPVLDIFNEAIARQQLQKSVKMTIFKKDGVYYRDEVTEEDVDKGTEFLKGIVNFITNKTSKTPVVSSMDVGATKYDEYVNTLGEDSIASIFIAKEKCTFLYTDDMGLKSIAKYDWNVEGISTQSMLGFLFNNKLIEEEIFRQTKLLLINANYEYIHLTMEDLYYVLNKNNFELNDEVFRVFSNLHGPKSDTLPVIVILANLIKEVWLSVQVMQKRFLILDLVINTLMQGRNSAIVINRFKIELSRQFSLLNYFLNQIFQSIDLTLMHHKSIR